MSALIFVALAVAWAVYLIPQALKQHEAGESTRGVDRFSDRMRVLARREAVDKRTARLVIPGRPARVQESSIDADLETESSDDPDAAPVAAPTRHPATPVARRERARAAARRRRRVLITLAILVAATAGVALAGVIAPFWIALPAALLVAWLVACRLMVKGEQASSRAPSRSVRTQAQPDDGGPSTEEFDVVLDDVLDEPAVAGPYDGTPSPEVAATTEQPQRTASTADGWDPIEVPLPTYVDKQPAARRSVRTIDLESTGVWTSGRTSSDADLAREADEAARARRASTPPAQQQERRRRA